MPSNYSGDASATQPPSDPPSPEGDITVAIPADADLLNADSVIQAFKVLADWVKFLLAPFAKASDWAKGIMAWRTSVGHQRANIDHMGLPGGQHFGIDAYWHIHGGSQVGAAVDAHFTAFPAWRCKTAGASSTIQATAVELSGAAGGPSCTALAIVACNSGGADGDYVAVTSGPYGRLEAWRHLVMEVRAGAYNGVANVDFASIGFGNYGGAGAVGLTNFIGFETRGGTTWQCVTRSAGVETVTNTAIPIERDNSAVPAIYLQRLRVEFHGENVADDANRRVRFVIDGTVVATHSTNIPANTAPMYGVLGALRSGGVKDGILVGPLSIRSSLYGADVS